MDNPQSELTAAQRFWRVLTPRPKTRNLIVGSVGSGKSTFGSAILENYHRFWPSHRIYIIDPKQRFVVAKSENPLIFPEGTTAKNHGRVEGVTVNGKLYRGRIGDRRQEISVYVVQDVGVALELYDKLFKEADVRYPVMIYNDESMDLHRSGLLDYRFKRIVQMGREKGIGHITINQRPKRIDVTLISESERLYVGTLHNINDRRALSETVSIPEAKKLLTPMGRHVFWMIDQVHPERSIKVRLAA